MGAALACFCAASPLPASAQLERWTLERTVTIGDAFDPETGLTRVGRVIVQGDRMLVAQPLEHRLRVFSLTGDFLGPIRVPAAWRSRHVERQVRDIVEEPTFPEGRIRRQLERAYGALEFFPPVGGVRAVPDGSTWLRLRTGVESFEWEVLDESGRAFARVDAPQGRMAWVDAESLWFVEPFPGRAGAKLDTSPGAPHRKRYHGQ